MARPVVMVNRHWLDFPPPTPQRSICKIWQGAVDRDGYGTLTAYDHWDVNTRKRSRQRVIRWVWEQANHRKIPRNMVVRHKCDNRICFRLGHLELGTVAQNNEDARLRGHLGPAFSFPPSRITQLFDDWEAWEGSASKFWNLQTDIPNTTVRRYLAQGREHFFPPEQPDGNPEHGHPNCYEDAPGGVHPVERLYEELAESLPTRRGQAAGRVRDFASWRDHRSRGAMDPAPLRGGDLHRREDGDRQ